MSAREVFRLGDDLDGDDVWLAEKDDGAVLFVGTERDFVGSCMTPERARCLAAMLRAWADGLPITLAKTPTAPT